MHRSLAQGHQANSLLKNVKLIYFDLCSFRPAWLVARNYFYYLFESMHLSSQLSVARNSLVIWHDQKRTPLTVRLLQWLLSWLCLLFIVFNLLLLELFLNNLWLLWLFRLFFRDFDWDDLGHFLFLHVILRWITVRAPSFVSWIILRPWCQQSFVVRQLCNKSLPSVHLELGAYVVFIQEYSRSATSYRTSTLILIDFACFLLRSALPTTWQLLLGTWW